MRLPESKSRMEPSTSSNICFLMNNSGNQNTGIIHDTRLPRQPKNVMDL